MNALSPLSLSPISLAGPSPSMLDFSVWLLPFASVAPRLDVGKMALISFLWRDPMNIMSVMSSCY